jgi:TRAP-type C4-dicarboxylate transport system permease small subunit
LFAVGRARGLRASDRYGAMTLRAARVAWWLVAATLLLVSAWSFNLATYNWFAADMHDKYSQVYASRGNVFLIVALALFGATLWVIVALFRSRKKRR